MVLSLIFLILEEVNPKSVSQKTVMKTRFLELLVIVLLVSLFD